MRGALLLCVLLLTAVTATAATDVSVLDAPAPVQELWSAGFRLDASPRPPAGPFEPVQLPDRWVDPARYEAGVIGWYRLELPSSLAPVEDEIASVYLWRYNMAAEVWFNGTRIADSGRIDEPVTRNWNHPLLVDLPSGLWRRGGNVLDIRLRAYPVYGFLAPVFVGARDVLEPAWRVRTFLQVELSAALLVLTLTLAAVGFALWLARRSDREYLYFALACLAYSAYSLNLVVRDVPVAGETWWWLMHAAMDWWAIGLLFFGFRLMGERHVRIERGALAYGVATTTLQAAVDLPTFAVVCHLVHVGSMLMVAGLMVRLVVVWRRTGRGDLLALAMGLVWILLLAIHDSVMNTALYIELWRFGFFLMNLGAPLVFVAMAWHLIRRYSRALAELEVTNASLEARVEEARDALDASYAERRSLELARAAGEERERIYRDLHDDVGARLLSLVYATPDETSRSLARDALAELRELVAHSGAEPGRLSVLADRLAEEIGTRARSASITFEQRRAVDADPELASVEVWHLTRILREATSNAIRHAQAGSLQFEVRADRDGVHLTLRDDGVGGAVGGRGRGLRNMQARAEELRAQLEVGANDDGPGTRVELHFAPPGADESDDAAQGG